MTRNTTGRILMAAVLFGLMGPAVAAAREATPTGYVMNFYVDSAQGAAVENGAYDIVIEKLTKRVARGAQQLADQVNLCVAYTKTGRLEKAMEACDRALEMAARRTIRPNLTGIVRSDHYRSAEQRVVALVNRGVLHAVAGDSDLARELFEMADGLDTRNESAAINLLVLQREMAERDS